MVKQQGLKLTKLCEISSNPLLQQKYFTGKKDTVASTIAIAAIRHRETRETKRCYSIDRFKPRSQSTMYEKHANLLEMGKHDGERRKYSNKVVTL